MSDNIYSKTNAESGSATLKTYGRNVTKLDDGTQGGTGVDANAPRKPGGRYVSGRPMSASPPGTSVYPPDVAKLLERGDSTLGGGGPADELRHRTWPVKDSAGRVVGDQRSGLMPSATAQRVVDAALPVSAKEIAAAKRTKS